LSSRIKKPDIRQQLWPSILIKPVVAIGRGPYTSTHGPSPKERLSRRDVRRGCDCVAKLRLR
ncbi:MULTISPECIES: hypothetical protein, partial [unclassified Bradyrhizobium]|uniref:hypothetical protein n=1 Tax=unclassified Bradyrhizobium TaxID=2631580 RepID=UPI001FFC1D80